MKSIKLFWIVLLTIVSNQSFAYGTSSSSKSCAKPQFSEFIPANKAEAASQSNFSFLASSITDPKTIKVLIKKQAVEVNITPKGKSYQVSGTLPSDFKNTFVRINITAESMKRCKGSDGWLIKINE